MAHPDARNKVFGRPEAGYGIDIDILPALKDGEDVNHEFIQCLLTVYREQPCLPPLVQAMWGIPELHELDEHHDELIIGHLVDIYRRLGFTCLPNELNRLGRLTLESSHALLLVVVNQAEVRARRTEEDLRRVLFALLDGRRNDNRPEGLDNVEAP